MDPLDEDLRRLRTRVRLEVDALAANLAATAEKVEDKKFDLFERTRKAALRLTSVVRLQLFRVASAGTKRRVPRDR